MSNAACPEPVKDVSAPSNGAEPGAGKEPFGVLGAHLKELDRFLRAQLSAFEPEIRPLADYCIDASGKRIRPALLFLAGWEGPQSVPPDQVRAATVVELVHLATLVHDDIMDEAEVRRNRRTAGRTYGPSAAVLLGDALFAHALNLATDFPTTEVCAAVSDSTRKVCAGEIVQTLRRGSMSVTRADYRRVIELKTAELFGVSCRLGSRLAKRSPEEVASAQRFGVHLGVAYQMCDDLADFFGEERRIGKTLGTDLLSGKLTLPMIALMERLPPSEKAAVSEDFGARGPAQFALRLRQMTELGVFEAVASEIEAELEGAASAIRGWPDSEAAGLLLGLTGIVRGQLAGMARAPN